MKSTGAPDNVTLQMLIDCFSVIGELIVEIINESTRIGVFPDCWKLSTVIPIQKVAKTKKGEEHRPINMLESPEKIIEAVVKKQLKNFTHENSILIDEQSGFRSDHSCETSLNFVLAQWKIDQDAGKTIIAVFLDLQRAFETLDRSRLLWKMEKYGVHGVELAWFSSYLMGRKQVTKYGKETSSVLDNELGVPQGSILGPDLFLLYINDMASVLVNCKIKLFADDTLIWMSDVDISVASNKLNSDLNNISKWLKLNKLKLNIKKTKLMYVNDKSDNKIIIKFDNEIVEEVDSIKYLGVFIDNKLNFRKNTDFVIKKVSKKINFLNRIKYKIPLNQRQLLYKTIVAPHYDYCSSILFLCGEMDFKKLQILQNKGMRMVLNVNKYAKISSMLEALQWLNVRQRVYFNTLVTIFKIRQNMLPSYLLSQVSYVKDSCRYNLRSGDDFKVPHIIKGTAQNNLFYKGIKEFNDLPEGIKKIVKFRTFKNELSKYIKKKFVL